MSADLARPVVLRADARLVPASRLPASVRAATGARRGEHALVADGARGGSLLVDGATAALLRRLTTPRRVADVLLEVAAARGDDPDAVLDAAFPLLERLARAGWLVAPRDASARAGDPTFAVGDRVGAWEVMDRLRAVEDTENYQVRDARGRIGALKLVRDTPGGWLEGALDREARALRRLGRLAGGIAPRLLARGEHEGAAWLVTAWREGVHLTRAAADCRAAGDGGRSLLALARAVVDAYAALHDAGVLHGDVHPSNVLVARDGTITLLDFGHAIVAGDPGPAPARAGIPEYYEPELAHALRRGARAAPATAAGEQHAVGALLYEVFTGRRWRDFSLVRDELLRQVIEEPPLAFADAGAPPWPAVERVLRRALAKQADHRHESVAALARALAGIAPPRVRTPRPSVDAAAARRGAFVDEVLRHAHPDGPWRARWPRGTPRWSARDGAAGVAYALHRIAAARDDARALAWADVWSARAEDAARRRPDQLFDRTGTRSRAALGEASFHHGAAGVHAVRALVARAAGDAHARDAAVAAFLRTPRETPHPIDLSFGTPGLLAAAALLRDATESAGGAGHPSLAAAGDALAAEVLATVRAGEGLARPGVAHGLAGALHALLSWYRDPARVARLRAPLRDLARHALPLGRGLRWAWERRAFTGDQRPLFAGGWCNGTAGYVHLWLAAHRRLGDDAHLDLATRAAWHAWESPSGGASLCCGDAGRAYALLALHRHTDDEAWLRRARTLADRALATSADPTADSPSLYQGALGVAVLLADLERPAEARMPLFETEGWRD